MTLGWRRLKGTAGDWGMMGLVAGAEGERQ